MKKLAMTIMLVVIAATVGCEPNPENAPEVAPSTAASMVSQCEAVAGTQLGNGTVTDATHVEPGEELVSLAKKALLKVFAPDLPDISILAPRAFCRVEAELSPVEGSLIKAQVWLPDEWNGKMHSGGGGGFNGGLFGAAAVMLEPSIKGYASVVSDVGHDMSGDAKFAQNREQFIDYGYRANHETAVFTKELITHYYGKPASRAYFVGGSNGGREALMAARRYPGDFDGIIAGMPAMSFTRLVGISFLWNHQAVLSAPGLGAKLGLVTAAVMNQCDLLDGVADQVLENPLLCEFDPATLQCSSDTTGDCLTADEVAALEKIYQGPRLQNGTQVFPGYPVGGEDIPTNWDTWIFGEKPAQAGMGEEFLRWMVHNNPDWEKSQFDVDRDFPVAMERAAPIVDSDDPDLSEFLARGGKLIIHHGWADAAIPATSTLQYYDALRNQLGTVVDEHVRLFMVPGMLHGADGGHAPTRYDLLKELDNWVEGGPAPERIITSKLVVEPALFTQPDPDAAVARSRPLCAWPKTARYNGSGSTDDAANFTCQ